MANSLFGKVISCEFVLRIGQIFDLADVAAAHRALESRQTTGATILTIA